MKFEVDVSEDRTMTLSLDGKVILTTMYISRLLDVLEDVYKHDGKGSSLIPWPIEGEK